MARIRSIKPDYWSSEEVMSLSRDARLLFIGIWNFADDAGRIKWSPAAIKAQVLPGDLDLGPAEVEALMDAICDRGLMRRYGRTPERSVKTPESSGVLRNIPESSGYAYITGWHHQKISHPAPSKYPEPPAFEESDLRAVEGLQSPPENSGAFREDSALIGSDLKGSDRKGSDRKGSDADAKAAPVAEKPKGKEPQRFRQPLEEAVRKEFFVRDRTPQKASDGQWRDGCQTVQDALDLGAFPDGLSAIEHFALLVVNACADGEKLGFALQQTTLEKPREVAPPSVFRIREGA